MDLAVAVLILAVNLPLAGLLAWRAAQRRVPVFAAGATIVLLLASCSAAWDPAAEGPPARAAIAVANISLAILLAVYPDGRFTPRWIAVPAFVEVGLQAGNLATGLALEQQAWWPWHFLFTWAPLLLGGQLYRYVRRSSVAERERARWPLLALVAMVLGFLLWTIAVAAGAASDGCGLAREPAPRPSGARVRDRPPRAPTPRQSTGCCGSCSVRAPGP